LVRPILIPHYVSRVAVDRKAAEFIDNKKYKFTHSLTNSQI